MSRRLDHGVYGRAELLHGDELVDHIANEPARLRQESTDEEDARIARLMEEDRERFERENAGAVSVGMVGELGIGRRLWGGGRK